MANTSLNLGEHWEVFIKNEVASGHYGNASEVVRDALRNLEKHKTRLNALRSHLAEGAAQAAFSWLFPGHLRMNLQNWPSNRNRTRSIRASEASLQLGHRRGV